MYLYNNPFYVIFEIIYVLMLKMFRRKKKYPLFDDTAYEQIKRIAIEAFPETLQQICEAKDEYDFIDYCNCYSINQIYYLLADDWYVIFASHHNCVEIVECASMTRSCKDIFKIINYGINNFKRRTIIANCRESTSLPIFLAMEKYNRIKIINDIVIKQNGEMMHYLKFKYVNKNKRKRMRK